MALVHDIIESSNGSYRHVVRLLELGYTQNEINLKYIEKEFIAKIPRKKSRLLYLYKTVFRNRLLLVFDNKHLRKQVKEDFFNQWKSLELPFSDFIIDDTWDEIAKEVYLTD